MNRYAFTMQGKSLQRKIITPIKIYANGQIFQGKALWDTGATFSFVSPKVSKQLNLNTYSKEKINCANGQSETNTYIVDIELPCNVYIPTICVGEFVATDECDVIIGMDIISLGDFAISGNGNERTVSFRLPPNTEIINFLAEKGMIITQDYRLS